MFRLGFAVLLLTGFSSGALAFSDNSTLTLKGDKLVKDKTFSVNSPSPSEIDVSNQDQSFQDATGDIMAMSKEEIRTFRNLLRDYSKTMVHNEDLIKRSTMVSIDEKKGIYCSPGLLTTLNFVDEMGTPWPIDYILPSNQSVVIAAKVDLYTVMLSSTKFAGETNLVVKLKDIILPLNFYVYASDEVFDSMRVIKMHGKSPDHVSTPTVVTTSIPGIKSDAFVMEQFLADTPPSKALERDVDRAGMRIWTLNDKMYIRTTYVLASPMAMSDQGTVTDGRGMYVYRLAKDVSRLNMLIDGNYFSVKVNIDE